ncbi:MAG TPA: hypothetical protein PLU35_05990 [Phycisphaerales bacterium]|nr:hypothetical protein [Phycisphaerales bacterium]
MRNLGLRAALVIVALLFFGLAIVPPEKKLRLGKDLSGGVSLIYSVAIGPEENASETMSRVIEVLKRRVDPNGLYQITMVSQGRDRIEITMPLPGPRVKEKRAEYEGVLDSVGEMAIPRQRLERVIAMSPESRAAELDRLAAGRPARRACTNWRWSMTRPGRRARRTTPPPTRSSPTPMNCSAWPGRRQRPNWRTTRPGTTCCEHPSRPLNFAARSSSRAGGARFGIRRRTPTSSCPARVTGRSHG